MEIAYILTAIGTVIYSYGYKDPNMPLFAGSVFARLLVPLTGIVYRNMYLSAGIFVLILTVLSVLYIMMIRAAQAGTLTSRRVRRLLAAVCLLALSYPAFTYDMFNYMTTAKVLYHYHENPYVVMPVELTGEPFLAFTRAANKVALYGPVWLGLSAIPFFAGGGMLFPTILSFKLFAALSYLLTAYLLYRLTRRLLPVVFFAFNPLVIIEVLVSGHNDLWMMLPAVAGLYLFWAGPLGKKAAGVISLVASVLVKGATLALVPAMLSRRPPVRRIVWAFWGMVAVMVVFGPLREELYPWYAVWALVFAAILAGMKRPFVPALSVIASIFLELRHLPYIATMRYDGYAPLFKSMVTVIPALTFSLWYLWKRKLRRS